MGKSKKLMFCSILLLLIITIIPLVNAVTTIAGSTSSVPPGRLCYNTITAPGEYELASDLWCDIDPVIIINSNDVSLDCAGYKIIGRDQTSTYGVYVNGADRAKIMNCNISRFDNNIQVVGSGFSNILNNSLTSALTSGINLENDHDNSITGNYFYKNAVSGIKMLDSQTDLIEENYILNQPVGIDLTSGDNNDFLSNSIFLSSGNALYMNSGGSVDYALNNNFESNAFCDTSSGGYDFFCEAKSTASGKNNYFDTAFVCSSGYPIVSTDYSLCSADTDGDTLRDYEDNCVLVSNVGQSDIDLDGIGDLCDTEFDDLSCSDGLNNDDASSTDTGTDCEESECDGFTGPDGGLCEYAVEVTCNDGLDNDGDGSEDCYDSDCDGVVGGPGGELCEYDLELTCTDGFDNDGNGVIDLDDTDGCAVCADTDGGYDTAVVGSVTGTSYLDEQIDSSSGWTDFCTGDGELVEYWCHDSTEAYPGYAYGELVDCGSGYECSGGICVESAGCVDDYSLCITETECDTDSGDRHGDGVWSDTLGCLDPTEDYDSDCIVNGDEIIACLDSDVTELSSCLSVSFEVYSSDNDATGCVLGDIDYDGDIDSTDLVYFNEYTASYYGGAVSGATETFHPADINSDGVLTFADILEFVAVYVTATSS